MIAIAPEDIDVALLPSLALFDVRELPKVPAIYFVLSCNNNVLYIGRTLSLNVRWQAHHRFIDLARLENIRIAWLSLSDASLLRSVEKACIAYFCPSMNKPYGQKSHGYTSTLIRLPLALLLWAKAQPEGISGLARQLFAEEQKRREQREKSHHSV